jgi:hypothetical protein
MKPVLCPYCGKQARYSESSAHLYRGQDYGPVVECVSVSNCDAYVGVHRDGPDKGEPMGRLANKALRQLKIQAHEAFDPLHRDLKAAYPELDIFPTYIRNAARGRAYAWLADQMGVPLENCHIAAFNDAQCRQAIDTIAKLNPTSATIRAWWKAHRKERS